MDALPQEIIDQILEYTIHSLDSRPFAGFGGWRDTRCPHRVSFFRTFEADTRKLETHTTLEEKLSRPEVVGIGGKERYRQKVLLFGGPVFWFLEAMHEGRNDGTGLGLTRLMSLLMD